MLLCFRNSAPHLFSSFTWLSEPVEDFHRAKLKSICCWTKNAHHLFLSGKILRQLLNRHTGPTLRLDKNTQACLAIWFGLYHIVHLIFKWRYYGKTQVSAFLYFSQEITGWSTCVTFLRAPQDLFAKGGHKETFPRKQETDFHFANKKYICKVCDAKNLSLCLEVWQKSSS